MIIYKTREFNKQILNKLAIQNNRRTAMLKLNAEVIVNDCKKPFICVLNVIIYFQLNWFVNGTWQKSRTFDTRKIANRLNMQELTNSEDMSCKLMTWQKTHQLFDLNTYNKYWTLSYIKRDRKEKGNQREIMTRKYCRHFYF